MRQISLNMLNYAVGVEASNPVAVTKEEFWNIYLELLAVKNNVHLAERTKGFFVEILCGEIGKNYFSGDNREAIAKKLDLHNTQFTHFSKELTGCGYMEKLGRGIVMPKESFMKMQKMLETEDVIINFLFPIVVNNE